MKNIAVIGCGYWGKNLIRNFYSLGALHTICDSSEKIMSENKKLYPGVNCTASYENILSDSSVKAVVIATPAETHFRLAKQALMNDKDVFVEKPLAFTLEEGKELIQLASDNKKILMVDHLLQYHPAVAKLKDLIKDGAIGAVQYIYSNRLNIGKFRTEENILWSFAPHDISVILSLVGEMPVKVEAFGEAYLQKNIYDTTLTTLTFNKRLKAHIFVSWLHPFKEQKLVVVGSKNMAVFDDTQDQKLVLYPHRVDWVCGVPIASKAPHESVELNSEEPLKAACQHFLDCVNSRKKPLTDGAEALRVLEVLHSAQKELEKI